MRKADNLPPSCAVVTKSGNLNFLEPSGPVQACNGTDFFLHGGDPATFCDVIYSLMYVHLRFRLYDPPCSGAVCAQVFHLDLCIIPVPCIVGCLLNEGKRLTVLASVDPCS